MVAKPALRIDRLSVDFDAGGRVVHAVRDATLQVLPGRICGLVGESGSGKTITGLSVLGLVDRARTQGEISVGEIDVLGASEEQLRRIRGSRVGIVFQDPMTALNPLLTIGRQVSESLETHLDLDRRAARARAIEVLAEVGMPDPARRYDAYPHQLSGGLRQRAMIAVAVACRPSLLIADEPTTALDVTIQAQILRLLRTLAASENLAVLLITHDLGVVAQTCDDIVVMYAGEVVETGTTRDVLADPRHPYTKRLLEARPRLDGWQERLESIPGRVPAATMQPPGCLFLPRCPEAQEGCEEDQELVPVAVDRVARCWKAVAMAGSLQ